MHLDVTCLDFMGLAVNAGLLIVAIVALQFAQEQSREARRSNELTQQAQRDASQREKEAAQQAIEDSRRANRPYLWVELRPGLFGPTVWDLSIRNTGRTAARDIILEAPWPEPGDRISQRLQAHLTKPFDLPPGSSVRFVWHRWLSEERAQRSNQPVGMPRTCTVAVSYSADDKEIGRIQEQCTLDASPGEIMPSPSQGATGGGSSDELKVMHNINSALRALNTHVGELRR